MEIGVIILCLILSAFFSGMEIAFISSNKLKIELDKKGGAISASIYSYFTKHDDHMMEYNEKMILVFNFI